jgi:protein LTV1
MQHLRKVGIQEEGVESVLIEAPSTSRQKSDKNPSILPSEALPSTIELPRNYEALEAVPSSIAGFKPDMDPHLRQVLEALDDEAFIDGGLEDDFFGQLVADGEREGDEVVDFEENDDIEEAFDENGEDSWEARFAKFKKEQKIAQRPPNSDEDEDGSEGKDTISGLPTLPVIGGKRRRKGTSDASGYSMSSSSIFRTEALQTLDERFDKVY